MDRDKNRERVNLLSIKDSICNVVQKITYLVYPLIPVNSLLRISGFSRYNVFRTF